VTSVPAVVPFVNMQRHFAGVQPEVDAAMARVFRTGVFILGPEGRAFEEEFAAYCGSAHGIGVSSGTDALFLALLAAGVGPGDEVLTVANTAVPTVTAVTMTGATPRFVDVLPETYLMDPALLEGSVTPRT
jgi:dTDP-4-amino-4,6-dideoxygalactose transaminase